MLHIEQALASSSIRLLRDEISERENEAKINFTDQAYVNQMNDEISEIRTRIYQLLKAASKGRINYVSIPGLI